MEKRLMNTSRKGKIGEDRIVSILKDHQIDCHKTVRSGSTYGDGDIVINFDESTKLNDIIIDSKNEAKVSKTLMTKLKKIEEQASKYFDYGCIVDFDEEGRPYVHMRLDSFAEILSKIYKTK